MLNSLKNLKSSICGIPPPSPLILLSLLPFLKLLTANTRFLHLLTATAEKEQEQNNLTDVHESGVLPVIGVAPLAQQAVFTFLRNIHRFDGQQLVDTLPVEMKELIMLTFHAEFGSLVQLAGPSIPFSGGPVEEGYSVFGVPDDPLARWDLPVEEGNRPPSDEEKEKHKDDSGNPREKVKEPTTVKENIAEATAREDHEAQENKDGSDEAQRVRKGKEKEKEKEPGPNRREAMGKGLAPWTPQFFMRFQLPLGRSKVVVFTGI